MLTHLVLGGAGYIGSHTCVELVEAGYDFVIFDNLFNSQRQCLDRIAALTRRSKVDFVEADMLDPEALDRVFTQFPIKHVIHFAGFKAVGESVGRPLDYYRNNVVGSLNLFEAMKKHQVFNIIFSSSSTTYGVPQYLPVDENHPRGACTNPYGRTKYMIECILDDLSASDARWNIVKMRYFNPVGAHKSGLLGEDPRGPAHNLMPNVCRAALEKIERMKVFGNDYPNPDGTCIRDYTHVVDVAKAHVLALKKVEQSCGLQAFNLGLGHGFSVFEMIKAMEEASGRKIPYEVVGRRRGDTAACYSNPAKAEAELGYKAKRGLKEMCDDLWHFTTLNPEGYSSPMPKYE